MIPKKFAMMAAVLLAAGSLSFGNGLNLNGLGSRAVSMGGAFVGLANDPSAIFWNPAGLVFAKAKTFSFYGVDIIPYGSYNLTLPSPVASAIGVNATVVDAKTTLKHYLGGMVSYIHPLSDKLVAAFGIYQPSGLGAAWDAADLGFISGGRTDIDWSSKTGLITFAPTLAYKVSEKLSFGAQLNINYGVFQVNMYAGNFVVAGDTIDLGQYEEADKGWGVGATFSALFKPSEIFSLGATLRMPSTVKLSGSAAISNLSYLGFSGESDVEREITWPLWFAVGAAFKPLENLTLTADVQYTNWKTMDMIEATYKDAAWAQLMAAAGQSEMPLDWKSRAQIRVGAEYALNPAFAVRAGYYYDPAPAPDTTMNMLLPNYEFNGLTGGLGYSVGSLRVDFGVELLMGKDRDISFLKTFLHPLILNPVYDPAYADAQPGKYGMTILVPNFQVTYRF